MKQIIKNIPILGAVLIAINRWFFSRKEVVKSSEEYWKTRYKKGGNSGLGSYNQLAEFKAEVINSFVQKHNISSVIEFGCGDGNQLRLAQYPSYLGFDVSEKAISICRELFSEDTSKQFALMKDLYGQRAQLTLSLDVIYHLLEDHVFEEYMRKLFDTSDKYVVIYSSNTNEQIPPVAPHVKHRKFTDWIDEVRPNWKLIQHIPNKYPYFGKDDTGSFADFYIYEES